MITESEFVEIKNPNVSIQRTEYERLLYLTTPQPIETAPRDSRVLMNAGSKYSALDKHWVECFFVENEDDGEARPEHATHWLPLPNGKRINYER